MFFKTQKGVKIEKPIQTEENWIWVDGIKGMNENMQGYNKFQFEIGKTYHADGIIKDCENGFHFSLDQGYIEKYYNSSIYTKNRFFHVRGLVREKDYQRYGTSLAIQDMYNIVFPYPDCLYHRLVSKEITIVREYTEEEYLKLYQNHPFIETMSDYKQAQDIGYKMFYEEKFKTQMMNLGYTEDFCYVFIKKMSSDNVLYDKLKMAKALKGENVSKDISIFLLVK